MFSLNMHVCVVFFIVVVVTKIDLYFQKLSSCFFIVVVIRKIDLYFQNLSRIYPTCCYFFHCCRKRGLQFQQNYCIYKILQCPRVVTTLITISQKKSYPSSSQKQKNDKSQKCRQNVLQVKSLIMRNVS